MTADKAQKLLSFCIYIVWKGKAEAIYFFVCMKEVGGYFLKICIHRKFKLLNKYFFEGI